MDVVMVKGEPAQQFRPHRRGNADNVRDDEHGRLFAHCRFVDASRTCDAAVLVGERDALHECMSLCAVCVCCVLLIHALQSLAHLLITAERI